ncbi:MAG: hypothetical protein JRJ01_16330 [Deltaproteobacteria bacterium]|nr:hypothetical protein [Deltaproteobacteria bacterium]
MVYRDPEADYGMGELKFSRLSYTNVFYDKQYDRIDKAPRVIVRKLMDADDFFDEFDVPEDKRPQLLHPDDSVRYTMEGTDRKTIDTNIPSTFEGGEKEFVLVLEAYERKKLDRQKPLQVN